MLVRLLYASRSSQPHTAALLESILTQSHTHNPSRGITGILCYSGDIFMQVLEGSRTEVNRLYATILRDPHHSDVELLHYEEISERSYSGWTMGRVDISRLNTSTVLKYSEHADFNPYANSGKMALAMLQELVATANIIGRA